VQQPSRIARVPANFGANTPVEVVAQVPIVPPLAGSTEPPITAGTPNGLVFRASTRELLFSDSGQSVIFRIADPTVQGNTCPTSASCVSLLLRDPLIASSGAPPVGSNGLAFAADESRLFIANTGSDQIVSFPLTPGAMGSVLVQDINGADGLIRGPGNTLVVTANRADQVVILDAATGRPLAELGEFLGVGADGAPIGLSTPASVTLVGDSLFVTNLSAPSADGAASPEAEVRIFTISRIPIPAALRGPAAAALAQPR
jgi:sugar lactone lactonase YvrE